MTAKTSRTDRLANRVFGDPDVALKDQDLERAIKIALANPDDALEYIEQLLGDPLEMIRQLDRTERAYLEVAIRRHMVCPLSREEQTAAGAFFGDLVERRFNGQNLGHSARRAIEGGRDSLCDLMRRHGWGPLGGPGTPIAKWEAADRAAFEDIWGRVKTAATLNGRTARA